MEFKTPTKAVTRIQLTPSSKKTICVICSIQIENTNFRLRLFHKDTKSSHCVLIEKLLQVEIINSASYADNVCRNCIRKVVNIENKVSKLKETFNTTRDNLEKSHGKETKKRMSQENEPFSKRPLFSSPAASKSCGQFATNLDTMTKRLEDASLSPFACEKPTAEAQMHCDDTSEKSDTSVPLGHMSSYISAAQKELKQLCSKETPSSLRSQNKDALASFSMDIVSKEMHQIMPTFTEFIENTVIHPRQSRNKLKKGKTVEPEIISSTAKLLHIFNRDLNVFQSLNSVILLRGGCKKSAFDRLNSTGNCLSYQATLNMVDKLVINWSDELVQWKSKVESDVEIENRLIKQIENIDETIDFLAAQEMPTDALMMELESQKQSLTTHRRAMHPGYYFIGDNVDMKTSVRQMTKQNQRKDHHMFNMCAYMNRVGGNMMDNTKPKADIVSVPFSTFIPNINVKKELLDNFSFLVAHIWCDFISWLHPYKCTLPKYISHEYMKATSTKTKRVNMGVLLKNEQYNDQMVDICQFLHKYVPGHDSDEEHSTTEPTKVLSGGDYLTFERHKSAQSSMANGLTPSSRLQGLIPKMEEFHNQAELLKVIWKLLYTTQSTKETGTLYAARNSLDAKDVSHDPSQDFYACTELLNKFSYANIVCGGLHHFGMSSVEDEPTYHTYNGEIGSATTMRSYILAEARKFIDAYISLDIPEIPSYGNQSNLLMCRYCGQFFRKAKSLRKHEARNHNMNDPLYTESETTSQPSSTISSDDFVLNHTKCALFLCLLHLNHADAIKLGDGKRIMNSNKHIYLIYKCHKCPKYAFGLLETLVQSSVLLTDRKAHELIWNRTVNYRGEVDSNFPNDLDIEHQNKVFKEQAHSYRGVFTEKAISRVSRSAITTEKILQNYDKVMKVFHPSGKHLSANTHDDTLSLIKQIHERKVYSSVPGRVYAGLRDIDANPFSDLEGDSLRHWISSSLKKFAQEHFYE